MGYNINDVSGNASGGVDQWTFDLDITATNSVSGDFNQVNFFTGADEGEASGGYSFSALSNPSYGSLTYNTTTGTYTFTVNRAAVIASGSDQTVSFTITGTSGGNSDTDTVTITILICVARGTLVDTAKGPVPVERLRLGDMIRTQDGPHKPLQWIGSRQILAAELEAQPENYPVRIRAGALGGGRPKRDLLVTPQHRVLLSDWRAELFFGDREVLVPAKSLINNDTIFVDRNVREVEYFHLLFEQHEVIFTESAPTESFHPAPYSLGGLEEQVLRELLILFPQLRSEDGYGPTARLSLKPWEGELLADGLAGWAPAADSALPSRAAA